MVAGRLEAGSVFLSLGCHLCLILPALQHVLFRSTFSKERALVRVAVPGGPRSNGTGRASFVSCTWSSQNLTTSSPKPEHLRANCSEAPAPHKPARSPWNEPSNGTPPKETSRRWRSFEFQGPQPLHECDERWHLSTHARRPGLPKSLNRVLRGHWNLNCPRLKSWLGAHL